MAGQKRKLIGIMSVAGEPIPMGSAVKSVNGKIGDVVLDAEDVGALPEDTPLFSGDYNDLTNKPDIPSIEGLATEEYVDNGLATKQDKVSYASLERLGSYLYKISFDQLPEENDVVGPIAGCTSFVRDGKLFRNLDWDYDNTAEFIVECKGFKGMSMIPSLNDGLLDNELIDQLPYHIHDGRNEDGIMVSSHVLINDWDYEGSGEKNIPLTKLPFLILSNLKSMDDINSLQDYLDNIQVNQYLVDAGYVMQFMVTDGVTTYVIIPSDEGYELVDATANPKMTNFKWVARSTVNRTDSDIQLHPTGIERFNLIDEDVTLEDLRFTLAYEEPDRLSEFIGLRNTDKYSTDEQLLDIYETAHQMYLDRSRDGSTWQTLHSVVYSKNGMDSLNVQENYDINYASASTDLTGYATIEYVDQEITNVEAEIPSLDGYATEQWVEDQGYLTQHQDISGKADTSYVDAQLALKQNLLTAGTDITIDENGVISAELAEKVYICEYNVTPFADIKAAVEEDKIIVCLDDSVYYQMTQYSYYEEDDEGLAQFTVTHNVTGIPTIIHIALHHLDGTDTWTESLENLQPQLTAGTNITIEDNVISATGGGTEVSGTNDGTNWTSITIDDDTYAIPSGGSEADVPVFYLHYPTEDNIDQVKEDIDAIQEYRDEHDNKSVLVLDADGDTYSFYVQAEYSADADEYYITRVGQDDGSFESFIITSDDELVVANSEMKLSIPSMDVNLAIDGTIPQEAGDYKLVANTTVDEDTGEVCQGVGWIEDTGGSEVSGTNDGTNWTSLTIDDDTYAIPQGGGSSYTFTNGLTENAGTISWDLNNNIKIRATNNLILRPTEPTLNNNISNNTVLGGTSGQLGGRSGNTENNVIFGNNCSCGYWYSNISRTRNNNIIGGESCSVAGSATSTTPGNVAKNNIVVGLGLDTVGSNKLVIGEYNAIDTDDSKALIIGNGVATARNNALTVSKTGVIECTNIPAPPVGDGSYKLTCTITGGVPTYTWEAN